MSRSHRPRRAGRRALGAQGPLTIERDEHGVVHVRAANEADLYRGLGYCHAFDRGLQMLLARILASGRGSEILASDDDMLAVDLFFRRLNFRRGADDEAEKLSAEHRALHQAYCEGVNAAFRQRVPWELRMLGYRPEPWTPADGVVVSRVIGYVGLAQSQADMERLFVELVQAGVTRDRLEELFPGLLAEADLDLLGRVRLGHRIVPEAIRWSTVLPRGLASNNWAIAGGKTASGLPIFANDPHLEGNRLPAVWYEVVLELAGRFCMAATMPGIAGPILGRTNDLAWGATYAFMDAVDSWVEECRDGGYRRVVEGRDQWLPFAVREEVIARRGKPSVTVVFHENGHGVLDGDPHDPGFYLTTSWSSAHDSGASAAGFIRMFHATGVPEGMRILGGMESAFNWVLADRHGNIGYQMSGRMPARRPGWSGFAPEPGWDEANDWQGFVPPEDLPRALNPEAGFIVTANEDLNHLGVARPINLPMGPYRAERIADLLARRDHWRVDDVRMLQMDVYSIQAARFLEILRPHLPRTREGDILGRWDCRYTPDSEAAALFERFYGELLLEVFASGSGREAVQYLLDETGIVTDFYFNFDRILLGEQSAWFGGASRDEVFARVAARSLDRPARPWGVERQLHLRHLILGGRLPAWFGLDAGPVPLRGNRATIHQGQIYRSNGRQTSFVPSYRLVTDLAEDAAHTALAGGPSDRPFNRWYASEVASWAAGRLKVLRPSRPESFP